MTKDGNIFPQKQNNIYGQIWIFHDIIFPVLFRYRQSFHDIIYPRLWYFQYEFNTLEFKRQNFCVMLIFLFCLGIDEVSRILFPLGFAVFNIIYWVYYLIIAQVRYKELRYVTWDKTWRFWNSHFHNILDFKYIY